MPQENLLKKYNITKEELEIAVKEGVHLGKVCNTWAMLALCDLIACGDIKE